MLQKPLLTPKKSSTVELFPSEFPLPAVHLLPSLQCYKWGTKGKHSIVAKLLTPNFSSYSHDINFSVDEDTHYAELWIGVHPMGMSKVMLGTKGNPHLSSSSISEGRNGAIFTDHSSTVSSPFTPKLSQSDGFSLVKTTHHETGCHKTYTDAYAHLTPPNSTKVVYTFISSLGYLPLDEFLRKFPSFMLDSSGGECGQPSCARARNGFSSVEIPSLIASFVHPSKSSTERGFSLSARRRSTQPPGLAHGSLESVHLSGPSGLVEVDQEGEGLRGEGEGFRGEAGDFEGDEGSFEGEDGDFNEEEANLHGQTAGFHEEEVDFDCENGSHCLAQDDSLSASSVDNLLEISDEKKFGMMPFMLKVLAISGPLSLQAHPDAALAKSLFSLLPKVYSDPNPKPELIIALGSLEALAGFRPLRMVAYILVNTPEMLYIIGSDVYNMVKLDLQNLAGVYEMEMFGMLKDKACDYSNEDVLLKRLFGACLKCDEKVMRKQVLYMVERMLKEREEGVGTAKNSAKSVCVKQLRLVNELFLRLYEKFPSDSGIFSCFFLEYVQLSHGDALFIAPNMLHCYLSGQGIECMANSNNVVRGGLTSKPKDIDLLLKMVDFKSSLERVTPVCVDSKGYVKCFRPTLYSVQDFKVLQFEVPPKCSVSYTFTNICPAIGIVILSNSRVSIKIGSLLMNSFQGATMMLKPGSVLHISNEFVCPEVNKLTYDVKTSIHNFIEEDVKISAVFLMYCATCGDDYLLTEETSGSR